MQSFLLILCVFTTLCSGAKLRHQTTTKSALSVMQQRYATKKSKTAFNGKEFTSILDHPSTAAFFQGKDETEIANMVDSVVFAHMVGHSAFNTKPARTNAELRGASFVQLAASHGITFKTLQALHKKSGKGHLDMEIWWREQALHASVHMEQSGEASMEHLERDAKNHLENTLLETFQAETSKKNRASKVAMKAKTSKATKMAATKSTAETSAKKIRASKVAMNVKTPEMSKTAQTSQAKMTATLVTNDNSKTRTTPITTNFLSLKTDEKMGSNNYGDLQWSEEPCDDGSRWYRCWVPTALLGWGRCVGAAGTKAGEEHCYANDECAHGTCHGNGGIVCVGSGGKCGYGPATLGGYAYESCNDGSRMHSCGAVRPLFSRCVRPLNSQAGGEGK